MPRHRRDRRGATNLLNSMMRPTDQGSICSMGRSQQVSPTFCPRRAMAKERVMAAAAPGLSVATPSQEESTSGTPPARKVSFEDKHLLSSSDFLCADVTSAFLQESPRSCAAPSTQPVVPAPSRVSPQRPPRSRKDKLRPKKRSLHSLSSSKCLASMAPQGADSSAVSPCSLSPPLKQEDEVWGHFVDAIPKDNNSMPCYCPSIFATFQGEAGDASKAFALSRKRIKRDKKAIEEASNSIAQICL